MSRLILNAVVPPSPPASGKIELYYDSEDNEVKYMNEFGEEIELTPIGLTDQNLIINGGFDFAQNQTPGTLTTYSNLTGRTMVCDNWKLTNENASAQYQRIDADGNPETGLLARFYGKLKKITSAGKICISQVIGASDMAGTRGDVARIQVKLKASTGMTVRLGLLQLNSSGTLDTMPATFISAFNGNGTDPGFGTNLALLTPVTADTGTINGNAVDCVLTTGWQRFSALFNVPSNCKNLILIVYSNSQMAANDEINLAEAYLSQGASIKDWAPSPLTIEQIRAQAVYCKTFAFDSGPVQNFGLTGAIKYMSGRIAAVAEGAIGSWRFPTTMRTTPTLTAFNPSAANAQVRDVTSSGDCSSTSFLDTNDSGTTISCTGNVLTIVGNVLALHIVADATI